MANPSQKSEALETFLRIITGVDRRDLIRQNRCMPHPLGCGGPAAQFSDALSRREYEISGLCQHCQDSVFGDAGSEY